MHFDPELSPEEVECLEAEAVRSTQRGVAGPSQFCPPLGVVTCFPGLPGHEPRLLHHTTPLQQFQVSTVVVLVIFLPVRLYRNMTEI